MSALLVARPERADLDSILADCADLWPKLKGQSIFVTGGTGFFGSWLLEAFHHANETQGLDVRVTVLTRNAEAARAKRPHLYAGASGFALVEGDVRDFAFPAGKFSHLIHLATDASVKLNAEDPILMYDTVVEGMRRVLDFARACGAQDLLFASSGAVYGRQPLDLDHVPETYLGGPDPLHPLAAYGEGKRVAEFLGSLAQKDGIRVKIARCFAFVGPYLPLDGTFAAGNFILDALESRPLRLSGDGTPRRSYLYATEMVVALLKVLVRGQAARAYNVGSEESVSIAELAHAVADPLGLEVQLGREPDLSRRPERYVPAIPRLKEELGFTQKIPVREAMRRTLEFYQRAR